ncbi:MAG: Txe/YoeB family addiction module toxin [Alphaproteobacteria bacterium]|nr:Txe/YoeB family addiction module toxin [Alphaproteobacteria bacterium]
MKIAFTAQGWADYLHWQEADSTVARRVKLLIEETPRMPFTGIGKPESLRGAYAGWWSRRVSGEHRLVHRASGQGADRQLEIAQCRYHY